MTYRHRVFILLGAFAVVLVGLLFLVDPIPQNPGYHDFADKRSLLSIVNFGDVVSNAGFAVIGLLGLIAVLGPRRREHFAEGPDAAPYLVFFCGVGLVGIGSAYYHLAPDSGRLFWDRMPMTVAFMGLFAAIVADRIDRSAGNRVLLPVFVALGLASVVYWDWTEAQGVGDLRFYYLIQGFPMAALPLILWLFPDARYTRTGFLIRVFLWYAAALALDYFDDRVFAALGGTVSGHTLKHLAAAVATYYVLRMVTAAKPNGRA